MFHIVFSVTSRFLYLRNILQGIARGLLALRSLDTISSYLTPALPPPPPVPLLSAPVPFAERPEQIMFPYPSRDVIAIQRQFPVSASPFPIYQSSLIAVTPNHFPKFLPVLIILAVISGFVIILPEITYFIMNIAKSFKSKPMFYCPPASLPSHFASSKLPISLVSLLLLWTGPPAIATFFTFVWFTSILFSYERSSNMIVTILQWCGLLIVQDTRTPPLLDAIYEQITRGAVEYSDLVLSSDLSDEHDKYTDYSLDYSHLTVPHNTHELDLQNTPMQMESQEPEVSLQRIHTESIDSQSFYRQLELLRAREQKLNADLLASEQEREALVENLYVSRRNQQGWKEIAGVAKSLYLESEEIISNLRADLADATDHVRNVEEQLDHQIELASSKDSTVKSITKELRLADIRLRIANHKIDHSDVTLQEERDRRIREKKELMREKAMTEDRHKSEIRRLIQEAQDAQEQLNALRHTVSQLRSDDHPLDYPSPTTWPYDTGQPPLPPERNIDSGTPPGPGPSYGSTTRSPCSPTQDTMDSSTCLAACLSEIPGFCDQESEAVKEQRATPADVTERMGQVEPESAEDMKPDKGDEMRLQEELYATKEQLRLAEEEIRDLRRELSQSRESLREVEAHVKELEHELDICQATVRDAQDSRHASEVKLTEATRLLRIHQAESESSMARAEESQFKCSQVTFLCTALRERITELETQIEKLKSSRKYRANSSSRSRSPIDLEAVTHDSGTQEPDSIFMTVPPSMPCLLDLPLPPSSSLSNDSLLYLGHPECPTIPLISVDSGSCFPDAKIHDTDAQILDPSFMTSPSCLPCPLDLPSPPSLSQSGSSSFFFSRRKRPEIPPTCTDSHSSSPEDNDIDVTTPDTDSHVLDWPLPPPRSEDFSLSPFHLPRTFLSERNSPGLVDWPPIEPSLLPEHGNDRQDDNSLRSLTEENENDSILLNPKALSPVKELDELEVLERHTSHDRDGPDRETWGLSQRIQTSDASPNRILSSPQIPTRERQFDIPVTPEGKLASRDHMSEPPSLSFDLLLPVFPRITLPRVSFSPSGMNEMLEHQLSSSGPGNNQSNTEVDSAASDPLLGNLPSNTQSGEYHPAEAPSPGELRHFSRRNQGTCRAVPAHERLDPFSTAGPAGVTSSWTSTDTYSLQANLPSVSSALDCQDVQRSLPFVDAQPRQTTQLDSLTLSIPLEYPSTRAALRSRNEGINSEAGISSSQTALGSLPSRSHNSVDQGTSMKARRQRDLAPQSGNITSAQSDLAPEALLSSSDDFRITTSRSSGLPLSQISNLPHESLPCKDTKTQPVKRITKSTPRQRLVPELPDYNEDDSASASGKARKGRYPNDNGISFCPRDPPSPDCFLPGDSVPRFASTVLEGQDHDLEDFVFFIPPDCPTSTPVAPRKWASRQRSVGSGAVALAGVDLSLTTAKNNQSDVTLGGAPGGGQKNV